MSSFLLGEDGGEPAGNDRAGFEKLGETAARMHAHVRTWRRPPWFERHTWDFDTSLGGMPNWGRWRDGMGMTPDIEAVLAETVAEIERRLSAIGKSGNVFGLVHGDMRLANLLMDGSTVKIIDFDDCGFFWYLYDCATTVSFFEHEPDVPELIQAWVRGYRRVGSLSAEEESERNLRDAAPDPSCRLDWLALGDRSRPLDGGGVHTGDGAPLRRLPIPLRLGPARFLGRVSRPLLVEAHFRLKIAF